MKKNKISKQFVNKKLLKKKRESCKKVWIYMKRLLELAKKVVFVHFFIKLSVQQCLHV